MLRIGVEIGRMFPDFVLPEGAGTEFAIHKDSTTLPDTDLAVVATVS